MPHHYRSQILDHLVYSDRQEPLGHFDVVAFHVVRLDDRDMVHGHLILCLPAIIHALTRASSLISRGETVQRRP